jgi:lipopolysaccharide/colanic/teichoic acid biosynthesis glycosyltransferase
MLNSERIHASRLPSAGEGIELIDTDRPSAYVNPKLHFSAGDSASTLRFRDSGRRRSTFGIRSRLAAYADSSAASHALPIHEAALVRRTFSMRAKRAVDIVTASLMLLVALPIFAFVAMLVGLTSPGPILFKQTRLGKNGKPFTCLKFRTMVQDAELQLAMHQELKELYAREFKIKDDPRITAVGRFLRKTSLDELPQLFNILEGSMSLVGPRPIVPLEIAKYGPYGNKLLSVRPGLTGVWQVCGRSDTTYDERIIMDMFYVDESSVSMDLKLLCSTVPTVIKRRGAY